MSCATSKLVINRNHENGNDTFRSMAFEPSLHDFNFK